jgi:S1-C subfamily serine protease
MSFARIATVVGIVAALALVAVPKADRLWNRIDSQQRTVENLRWQLAQLHEQHADLINQQQGLSQSQQDLASTQKQLAREQIGLASAQKEISSAQNAMLNGQTQFDERQQRLFQTQSLSLQKQEKWITGLKVQAEMLEREIQKARDLRDSLDLQTASSASHKLEVRQLDLRQQILHPVFQLSGGEAVGSAVLIHQGEDDLGRYYLALSCYHVVRDILEERGEIQDLRQEKLSAVFTAIDATETNGSARLMEWDIDNDLALLRLDTQQDLGPVAKIAPRQSKHHLGVFSEIYTVGCPLGTAAQATHGEITREAWQIDGQDYWMISSPAYFGNSGGGVFDSESLELVGIFAKIYTHGSYRPQVITHMGLAIPIHVIHDWLAEVGYQEILPSNGAVAVSEASVSE